MPELSGIGYEDKRLYGIFAAADAPEEIRKGRIGVSPRSEIFALSRPICPRAVFDDRRLA